MVSLTTLHLNDNQIHSLPSELAILAPNLQELALARNQFWEFPPPIFRLANLQVLGLGKNFIQEIPGEISRLLCLEKLWLNDNQLKSIPWDNVDFLKKSGSLLELNLRGNPAVQSVL